MGPVINLSCRQALAAYSRQFIAASFLLISFSIPSGPVLGTAGPNQKFNGGAPLFIIKCIDVCVS